MNLKRIEALFNSIRCNATGALDASSAVLRSLAVADIFSLLSLRVSLIAVGVAGDGTHLLSAIYCIPKNELDAHEAGRGAREVREQFPSADVTSNRQ